MGHHVIEYDEECPACQATGIYVGRGESDGYGVVCRKCNGTGCHHVRLEYQDFDQRKKRKDVSRVIQCNPGLCVWRTPTESFDAFGGMYYVDWLAGKTFDRGTEMRKLTCPAWWYQYADYARKPQWIECKSCSGLSFSDCDFFRDKHLCWKRFDKEEKQNERK